MILFYTLINSAAVRLSTDNAGALSVNFSNKQLRLRQISNIDIMDVRNERRPYIATLFLVLIVSINAVLILLVLNRGRSLRPFADDYCYGAVATLGVWESWYHWVNSWAGELILYALKTLLVGMPLATGIPFSSLVAFTATALGIGFLSYQIFRQSIIRWPLGSQVMRISVGLAVATTSLVTWWVSLQIGSPGNQGISVLTNSVTHWQDVNVGYVLAPSISLVLLIQVLAKNGGGGRQFASAFLIGLSVPLLSPLVGMAALILLPTLLFLAGLWGHVWERHQRRVYFVAVGGLSLGLVMLMLIPGTRTRLSIQGSNPIEASTLLAFISNEYTAGFGLIINWGLVYILVTFFILGTIISATEIVIGIQRLLLVTLGLFATGLLLIPVTISSQYFNYAASWHWIPFYLVIFMAMSSLGLLIGVVTFKLSRQHSWILMVVSCFTLLSVVIPASTIYIQSLTNSISARDAEWVQGATQMSMFGDVTPGSGWGFCWSLIEGNFPSINRTLFDGYEKDSPPTLPLPLDLLQREL